MGKMKELYTTVQELQRDPRVLEFEYVVRMCDSLNEVLYGVTPPEDFEE